jgi:hypothetical protein
MIPLGNSKTSFISRRETLHRARSQTAYASVRALINGAAIFAFACITVGAFGVVVAGGGVFVRPITDAQTLALISIGEAAAGLVLMAIIVEGLRQLATMFVDLVDLQLTLANVAEMERQERDLERMDVPTTERSVG